MEGSDSSNQFLFKDCKTSCETNKCNDNLDDVSELFSNGDQDKCYTCSYTENVDGSVNGDKNCCSRPDLIDDGNRVCPNYANAGCYTGTNSHIVCFFYVFFY